MGGEPSRKRRQKMCEPRFWEVNRGSCVEHASLGIGAATVVAGAFSMPSLSSTLNFATGS